MGGRYTVWEGAGRKDRLFSPSLCAGSSWAANQPRYLYCCDLAQFASSSLHAAPCWTVPPKYMINWAHWSEFDFWRRWPWNQWSAVSLLVLQVETAIFWVRSRWTQRRHWISRNGNCSSQCSRTRISSSISLAQIQKHLSADASFELYSGRKPPSTVLFSLSSDWPLIDAILTLQISIIGFVGSWNFWMIQ